MIIGLVSDTHGFFDPRLGEILSGSDLILHAGDVGSEDVLDELRRIAPVHAVRGNVDSSNSGLPPTLTVSPGEVPIHVLHILPATQADLESWARRERISGELPKAAERLLRVFDAGTEIVLFGHSHQPCLVMLGSVLWVNPGSAGRKRFSLPRTCAVMECSNDLLEARIVALEPYQGDLLKNVRVRRGAHV